MNFHLVKGELLLKKYFKYRKILPTFTVPQNTTKTIVLTSVVIFANASSLHDLVKQNYVQPHLH